MCKMEKAFEFKLELKRTAVAMQTISFPEWEYRFLLILFI